MWHVQSSSSRTRKRWNVAGSEDSTESKNASRIFEGLVIIGCLCLAWAPSQVVAQERESETARSADAAPILGARVDPILREMSEYLKTAREFSFQANVTYDSVLRDGQKIQSGATVDVSVRRPGKLRVEYQGDERQTQVIFNGRTSTVYDVKQKVYTVMEVPPDIDAALDKLIEEYGVSVPVADLIGSDPYSTLTERAQAGNFMGTHEVDQRPCHHLAFAQDIIDWQIWIDAGPRPVPRRLLITYKDEAGSPQYSATFSRWNFQPRHSDHYFKFQPPAGSDQIEFLPTGN